MRALRLVTALSADTLLYLQNMDSIRQVVLNVNFVSTIYIIYIYMRRSSTWTWVVIFYYGQHCILSKLIHYGS